jgi:L-threonylcarbamoyladenylate synthase
MDDPRKPSGPVSRRASVGDRLRAASQWPLPQHALSRVVLRLTRSRQRWLKSLLIRRVVAGFEVDLSEAAEPDLAAYPSFNDFFTRPLAPGARPLPTSAQAIASPVDGVVSQVGAIDEGRIFQAKGREANLALPMIVDGLVMAEELATEVSARFRLLARRFWPGPLTIITQGSSRVPLKVTGNTGRLAMRQPKGAIPLMLLEAMGQPLIATSANLSGQPTCTSGIEVFGVMDGKVDLVLDGGLCNGPGATTVDITEPYWKVLKQGAIPEREIASILEGA